MGIPEGALKCAEDARAQTWASTAPGSEVLPLRLGSQRIPDQRSNPACRTLQEIEQSVPLI